MPSATRLEIGDCCGQVFGKSGNLPASQTICRDSQNVICAHKKVFLVEISFCHTCCTSVPRLAGNLAAKNAYSHSKQRTSLRELSLQWWHPNIVHGFLVRATRYRRKRQKRVMSVREVTSIRLVTIGRLYKTMQTEI